MTKCFFNFYGKRPSDNDKKSWEWEYQLEYISCEKSIHLFANQISLDAGVYNQKRPVYPVSYYRGIVERAGASILIQHCETGHHTDKHCLHNCAAVLSKQTIGKKARLQILKDIFPEKLRHFTGLTRKTNSSKNLED